jgi:hypothetical protein
MNRVLPFHIPKAERAFVAPSRAQSFYYLSDYHPIGYLIISSSAACLLYIRLPLYHSPCHPTVPEMTRTGMRKHCEFA